MKWYYWIPIIGMFQEGFTDWFLSKTENMRWIMSCYHALFISTAFTYLLKSILS